MINTKYFVKPNDPILTKVASEFLEKYISTDKIQRVIKKMFTVAFGEQVDAEKPLLVGLAAPQIGISKRIILVDVKADGKGKVGDLKVFINPEIVWRSKEKNEWYEGCYSTGRVCGIVSRANKIRLKALDEKGEVINEEYSGYTARIFQHEIDHLDGKVFVDLISDDEKRHWVEENDFPKYRNNEAWRNWSKKCPIDVWFKIKGLH